MDSLIAAAAHALAAGDPLAALKRVALRDDAPALALRGIAMAQLGEHARARDLLRLAARRFGPREAVARARCVVAEAEVALALRDLTGAALPLASATALLDASGDHRNALLARVITIRRLVLLGRLDDATASLARLDPGRAPPSLAAVMALIDAELAVRSLHVARADAALVRARDAAKRAGIPALVAEVAAAREALDRPAARRVDAQGERVLRLRDVAALHGSGTLVVDACRRVLRAAEASLPLARRPVLFALLRALAQAWPDDVDRHALISAVFRIRRPDESHRARLRVEIGRARALVASLATIVSTARGYALRPHDGRDVAVLVPPIDDEQAGLVALLADGMPWSTSALALALASSQRSVQRALVELEAGGRVRAIGRGRARRWLSPPPAGFTTILLLPAALPLA